jgi:shikimate O-hydroxycinnamoyltransferase
VLSVTVSHAIADGYSYYYFLSAWAAACRGESFLKPDHSRHILTRLARHYREKRSSNHSNGFALTNLSSLSLSPTINPMTSKIETLLLDGASLVAEARKGANQSMRNKITENSVLTASIWQIYARSLSPDAEQIELACPVDFRRISSELSRSYFGNASAPAIVRLTRDEVLNGSIPHLAALISEAVRDCNETTLARYCAVIDDLRLEQGLAGIDRITLVDPGTGLIVTNVARFPLAPIDFGTGPFIQEATPTNYAGTAVIVAGEGSTVKVRLSYPELVRS